MFYKELKGIPLAACQQMIAIMEGMAKTELGLTPSDIITRQLRPDDIGAASNNFHKATGGTGWRNYVNTYTIADNRFVGINGISVSTAYTTQAKITRSGSDARYWHFQTLIPNCENKLMYVDDPVIIPQNHSLTIQLYSLASNTEKIRWIGSTTERVGLLVKP